VVVVAGADRLSWLHSLTTQHLTGLVPWRSTMTLVLSPHGHLEHHLIVTDDGTTTWLDVEPATAPALLTFLDSMRFLLRVEPAEVTDDWAVLSLLGPSTSGILSSIGISLPTETWVAAPLPEGGLVRRMPGAGVAADLLVPRASLSPIAEQLRSVGARPAGRWAYDALRVARRQPRMGFETDHRTIVQEGDWVDTAVHLDKGCYRGQETVARVHNLGRPPRRLILLHLDGSAETLPPHGAVVSLAGRPVGFLGTAVRHYELGPIGLAMVKRTVPDDAPLRVADVDASIDAA
jgi:folate-binding protein YgfZ